MGENIDMTLGMYFGLSTMVAAGIGNLFSDVVGLFFADFFGVSHRCKFVDFILIALVSAKYQISDCYYILMFVII